MASSDGRNPRVDRRTVVGLCVVAGAVLVGVVALVLLTRGGGGGSSGPALATSTSTTNPPDQPGPNAPVISGFDVPNEVRCDQASVVTASWKTTGAVGVQIGIDGPGPFGYYPASGTAELPFPCDSAVHTYRLVAVARTGATTSRTVQARAITP